MNAVRRWLPHLSGRTASRLGGTHRLEARYSLDLAGLLNRLHRHELDALAAALEVETDGSVGRLRARLWLLGAAIEAGGTKHLGSPHQPAPIVLGERLQFQRPVRGEMPAAASWPRAIPEPVPTPPPPGEPGSKAALLEGASRLIGVRMGRRGRDKGQYGSRVAELLGVVEHGRSEPDWRGLIELKTVPVVRDSSGLWRVKEDPAVSMEGAAPHKKLACVLWIMRVADDPSSPLLSWYYQERDDYVAALIRRDLHTRPKGPKGARTKGWYLRKRFFLDSGMLASLNG